MKTFAEALEWLDGLRKFGIKPGLERMNWLLARLEHPERRLKTIHVAGTNGKGSTVQFLCQILMEAGHEVGTFMSPHVQHATDRIAVNGRPIAEETFLEIANQVRPVVEELAETEFGEATEFEVMTLIAIVYFAKKAFPDVVIFEVGLGGRLDSTNIIHPMVSIITNVHKDHTDILGETLEEIAREKAGIIKTGVTVITAAEGVGLEVIQKTAKDRRAKCYRLGQDFFYENVSSEADGERFDFKSPWSRKEKLHIRLKGEHQIKNAALALMAIEYLYFFFGLHVEMEHIQLGLLHACFPARFEEMRRKPTVVFDGAHNPEAAKQLAATVADRFSDRPIHIVFAALKNKDVKTMIANLEKVADEITFTSFLHPNAHDAETLASFSTLTNKKVVGDARNAIQQALQHASDQTVIVVTGSLYFLSEVRGDFE